MPKFFTAIFCLIFFWLGLQAQKQEFSLYSPSYKFRSGVYLNVQQIKQNSPIPLTRIITSINKNDPAFFDILVSKKHFIFLDDNGQKKTLPTDSILAIAQNGKLYIIWDQDLYPLPFLGNLTLFIANVTITNYEYDPFYDSFASYETQEVPKQFILDLYSGKIYEATPKNLELLLQKYDQELFREYSKLSKRKKRKQLFVYIRKFNEKHPLYVPKL